MKLGSSKPFAKWLKILPLIVLMTISSTALIGFGQEAHAGPPALYDFTVDIGQVDSTIGQVVLRIEDSTGNPPDTISPASADFAYCGVASSGDYNGSWIFFNSIDSTVEDGLCRPFSNPSAFPVVIVSPSSPNSALMGVFTTNVSGNTTNIQAAAPFGGEPQPIITLERIEENQDDDGEPTPPGTPRIVYGSVVPIEELALSLRDSTLSGSTPSIYSPQGVPFYYCITEDEVATFSEESPGTCFGVDNTAKLFLNYRNRPIDGILQRRVSGQEVEIRVEYDEGLAGLSDEDTSFPVCSGSLFLGWVLCGITEILYNAISFFYESVVLRGLEISPLDDSRSANPGDRLIYDVWFNTRIVANVLFVGVFLLAVIGQAFSWFFTPYELKKIIPRLVIGVIGVQLSFYIVGFLITAFNILGAGIRGIMLAPVNEFQIEFTLGNTLVDLLASIFVSVGGVAAGAATIGLTGTTIPGLLMALPLILLPVLLLVLTASLVFTFRRILIVILVIFSPIAFVAWVLPGTERFAKAWWELLWKALFMYPLIIALIAAGELLARISTLGQLPNGLAQIVAIVSLFAPYFLIPKTFSFAGGVLSSLANGFTNAGAGVRERFRGDPRDPFSRAARMRGERDRGRAKHLGRFTRKNLPGIGTGMVGKNNYLSSAWRGGGARRAAAAAKGASKPRRGVSAVAGFAGGLAASALTRVINVDEIAARQTAGAAQGAQDAATRDASIMLAAMGFDDHPLVKGEDLPADYMALGKAMRKDKGKVQNMVSLSLNRLGTRANVESMAQALVSNVVGEGNLEMAEAQQIWDNVADNAGLYIMPDMQIRKLTANGTEIDYSKAGKWIDKMAGKYQPYQRMGFKDSAWITLGAVTENHLVQKEQYDQEASEIMSKVGTELTQEQAKEKVSQLKVDYKQKGMLDDQQLREFRSMAQTTQDSIVNAASQQAFAQRSYLESRVEYDSELDPSSASFIGNKAPADLTPAQSAKLGQEYTAEAADFAREFGIDKEQRDTGLAEATRIISGDISWDDIEFSRGFSESPQAARAMREFFAAVQDNKTELGMSDDALSRIKQDP